MLRSQQPVSTWGSHWEVTIALYRGVSPSDWALLSRSQSRGLLTTRARTPLRQKGASRVAPPLDVCLLLVSLLLQPMGVPCRSGEPACHCSSLSKFASNMGFKYARRSSTNVLSAKGAPCIQATSKTTGPRMASSKLCFPAKGALGPVVPFCCT